VVLAASGAQRAFLSGPLQLRPGVTLVVGDGAILFASRDARLFDLPGEHRCGTVDRKGHGCQPLIAPHFNLTVELPLKAIVRGYTWAVVPITWRNRRAGVAKLKIKEMGSRYLFICIYVWLEKYFSRGDYQKRS
jgi:hypothetical protein